ncbi:uncharacterized protein PF3D7_1120000-like isoform X2 [Montipora foliosa]|uniref:uncharacterized protein PF3D7_1120000-like isoform X2 n=1 Tax=Montipora foliosa TaxID=591990 RepID=UPI0035F1BE1C
MTSSGQSAWDRNYPMSEADFYEKGLPDDIGPHKWKDLARALGFNQASIDGIHVEKGNAKECCIEVLVRWRRQNGKGATAGKLTKALTKIGLKNLADRFPIKPNDTNRNDKIEETVREFCEQLISFLKEEDSKENSKARDLEDQIFQMSNRIKESEEEVSRLRARNNELQDGKKQEMEDLQDKLQIDMNACHVSEKADEEARERRISAQLQKYTHDLKTYVTSSLEVPEVKQDQLKTPVKLDLLKTLSEHLEDLYIATRDMVSETCKCSEDLKRDFYDFAYHGLRADHNELVHRFKDLEDAVQEMGEEEKEELQKVKEFQLHRESLIKELEEKWRALFSPPERLPETRWSESPARGEKSTDIKKVKRNTAPGARPKQKNLRDELTKPEAPLTSEDAPPIANVTLQRSVKRIIGKRGRCS